MFIKAIAVSAIVLLLAACDPVLTARTVRPDHGVSYNPQNYAGINYAKIDLNTGAAEIVGGKEQDDIRIWYKDAERELEYTATNARSLGLVALRTQIERDLIRTQGFTVERAGSVARTIVRSLAAAGALQALSPLGGALMAPPLHLPAPAVAP